MKKPDSNTIVMAITLFAFIFVIVMTAFSVGKEQGGKEVRSFLNLSWPPTLVEDHALIFLPDHYEEGQYVRRQMRLFDSGNPDFDVNALFTVRNTGTGVLVEIEIVKGER